MDEFLNTHPILPFTVIFFNLVSFLPIAFLIFLVQKSSFHSNCRYLFNAWLGGYFALFFVNISIALVALLDERGYLTQSIRSSPYRDVFYGLCTSCSIYCSMSEIALAIERIYSTVDPESYHQTTVAARTLVPLTIFLIDFSFLIGRIEFQYDQIAITGCIMITCDVMTIVTNTVSVRYNRKRFKAEFDNLNAKYQVKEAYQLATAMQPVYIAIFCMKCVIITVAVVCLQMENAFFIGYNEALYTTISAINASAVAIMLIKKHAQLRKHARVILGIRNSIEPQQPSAASHTREHFKSLETYWI